MAQIPCFFHTNSVSLGILLTLRKKWKIYIMWYRKEAINKFQRLQIFPVKRTTMVNQTNLTLWSFHILLPLMHSTAMVFFTISSQWNELTGIFFSINSIYNVKIKISTCIGICWCLEILKRNQSYKKIMQHTCIKCATKGLYNSECFLFFFFFFSNQFT